MAQVARTTIRNAGELNGFLKLRRPLEASDGALHLATGPQPAITEESALATDRPVSRSSHPPA